MGLSLVSISRVHADAEDLVERVPEEAGRASSPLLPLEPFPLAEPVPERRT